jgi:predicted nuclease of predicted toxin-antitoxin system
MAVFYADENFDYGVVERLRAMGHDVLTVQEAGEQGRDDARVLERATADGRCVLTFDRADFKRLHRLHPTHAGIVTCTRDNGRDALTARIDQAAQAAAPLAGQHIRVNRPHTP